MGRHGKQKDNVWTEVKEKEMKIRKNLNTQKARLTSSKYELLTDLKQGVHTEVVKAKVGQFTEVHALVIASMTELQDIYIQDNDQEKCENTNTYIEKMNEDFESVMNEVQRYTALSVESESEKEVFFQQQNELRKSDSCASAPSDIGQDLWRQMKPISIPVFNGDKRRYESWKAVFSACIDRAPATPEYKLLQLKQYVSGEAEKAIEGLGHSGYAYEIAKQRLERKFGGHRRRVALYLEDLENFRPIRPGVAKDLEKFADLLDVAVANLKEDGRTAELQAGTLYSKLQRKLTEALLTRYHRWIFENSKTESVEVLRQFVLQEAEFQTTASED